MDRQSHGREAHLHSIHVIEVRIGEGIGQTHVGDGHKFGRPVLLEQRWHLIYWYEWEDYLV